MDKSADATYPIHDIVAKRWSPVGYSDRPVEPAKLQSLLEAARWAPSSYNAQPWFFIVATEERPEEYNRMLHCLVEGNVEWAQHAPVLMITVARVNFERNGKPNRHAYHDVGLAMGNLLAQATTLDLYVHQMAGILPDKIRTTYGIPEEYDPVAGVAIGYLGKADGLPEHLQARDAAPRSRKALTDFVFEGTWGKVSPLIGG